MKKVILYHNADTYIVEGCENDNFFRSYKLEVQHLENKCKCNCNNKNLLIRFKFNNYIRKRTL